MDLQGETCPVLFLFHGAVDIERESVRSVVILRLSRHIGRPTKGRKLVIWEG